MKAYTNIEQSKKLAEILPIESANMFYDQYGVIRIGNPKERYSDYHQLPVWSLAALIDVLPDEVGDNYYLTLDKEGKEYCCCYEDNNGNSFRHCFSGNPVDACYKMVLKLHEQKLL